MKLRLNPVFQPCFFDLLHLSRARPKPQPVQGVQDGLLLVQFANGKFAGEIGIAAGTIFRGVLCCRRPWLWRFRRVVRSGRCKRGDRERSEHNGEKKFNSTFPVAIVGFRKSAARVVPETHTQFHTPNPHHSQHRTAQKVLLERIRTLAVFLHSFTDFCCWNFRVCVSSRKSPCQVHGGTRTPPRTRRLTPPALSNTIPSTYESSHSNPESQELPENQRRRRRGIARRILFSWRRWGDRSG